MTRTQLPWRRMLAEGFIIVVSILLALAADGRRRAAGRPNSAHWPQRGLCFADGYDDMNLAPRRLAIVSPHAASQRGAGKS